MHDKGYIHRDLDPSNIMITSDRKIKIIDYGIAKQLSTLTTQDQQLTTAGQFMGKATYASPELVVGDVVHQNETTDIYDIGIMLFQFIVGHVPLRGPLMKFWKCSCITKCLCSKCHRKRFENYSQSYSQEAERPVSIGSRV